MAAIYVRNDVTACVPKSRTFLLLALTTGAAVAVSATSLKVTRVTFYGYKAGSATAAPTNNTSTAYVGYADPTGAVVAAASPVFLEPIAAGSAVTLQAPIGTSYDLKDFSVLGATGDKVVVNYES